MRAMERKPANRPPATPSAAAQAKKRGPGRPPKKQPPPALRKDGIVETPTDAENRLELVYEDPMMFKSLFTYFKNLKARDIHIRCAPTGVTFFTRDSTRTCRVVAELPGASMNHFYCDDEFVIGLNRDHVEKLFADIDKSFYKITFIYRHDDPDNFSLLFKDPELDKECIHKVSVSNLDSDEELFAAETMTTPQALAEFPIEFVLAARQFKKTVTDAGHYSETLTVEKLGKQNPLQFTYTQVGHVYNEVYRAPEKIQLRSEVAEGSIFRCSVKIANVKSLASAMVTDQVRIYCRENADILFRSEIDALVMSTFTSLA